MRENVVYGLGGYLPDHPNGNVVERMVDNGDGTGTLIVYDGAGQITEERALTSLPVVAPEPVDPMRVLADVGAALAVSSTATSQQMRAAMRAASTIIAEALAE